MESRNLTDGAGRGVIFPGTTGGCCHEYYGDIDGCGDTKRAVNFFEFRVLSRRAPQWAVGPHGVVVFRAARTRGVHLGGAATGADDFHTVNGHGVGPGVFPRKERR